MLHLPAFPSNRASRRGSVPSVTRRVSPGLSSTRSNPRSRMRLSPAASVPPRSSAPIARPCERANRKRPNSEPAHRQSARTRRTRARWPHQKLTRRMRDVALSNSCVSTPVFFGGFGCMRERRDVAPVRRYAIVVVRRVARWRAFPDRTRLFSSGCGKSYSYKVYALCWECSRKPYRAELVWRLLGIGVRGWMKEKRGRCASNFRARSKAAIGDRDPLASAL